MVLEMSLPELEKAIKPTHDINFLPDVRIPCWQENCKLSRYNETDGYKKLCRRVKFMYKSRKCQRGRCFIIQPLCNPVMKT